MPPNVVLLTIDCLRADVIGDGMDAAVTPTIRKLSSAGTEFAEAYSTGPWTAESFPGILAGRLAKHCAYQSAVKFKALPDESQTIAGHLADVGYDTGARITNPQLSSTRNFDLGFNSFKNLRLMSDDNSEKTSDDGSEKQPARASKLKSIIVDLFRNHSAPRTPMAIPFLIYRWMQLRDWPLITADQVSDELLSLIHQFDQKSPFFVWGHYMDLHAPIHPQSIDASGIFDTTRHFYADFARKCEVESDQYTNAYISAIEYVDQQISRVIKGLREIGAWDDTVLVITSDHGEMLFEQGFVGHPPHNLATDLLHVPLIVAGSGVPNQTISRVTSLGWLHEIISEITKSGPMAAPLSTDRSHLTTDTGSEPCIISDSLTEEGHTIAVRDAETVSVRTRQFSEALKTVRYRVRPGVYDAKIPEYRQSPRAESVAPALHRTLADEYEYHPDQLPELSERGMESVKQRLGQLGYL